MILGCSDFTRESDNPNKLGWRDLRGCDGFTVLRGPGDVIVDTIVGPDAHRVTIGAHERIIRKNEVVPTAQLYLSTRKRRRMLADAPVLIIRPV